MQINTFPEFSTLTLDDKAEYDRLISDYPPLSDITFSTLQIWWNLEDKLQIALLNDNLVIDYYLPFDDENSGYSLIGKHDVDQSFEILFDHLKANNKTQKIVHVPEFVKDQLRNPENFEFVEETDYNEYILDPVGLAELPGSRHAKIRTQLNRFNRETEHMNLEIKPLDLSDEANKQKLYDHVIKWEDQQKSNNDPDHIEREAIQKTLKHSHKLGTRNLGLYADDELRAVIIYHPSHDNNSYIINHLKVDYSIPYIYDYMVHHLAKTANKENIQFLNMEMDLGIENLRRHKQDFKPIDFFRKYSVRLKS